MHWRKIWQPTPVFLPGESQGREAWWAAIYGVAQSPTQLKRLSSISSRWLSGKESPCKQETRVKSLGWEDALEKGMATQYSILAWEIP